MSNSVIKINLYKALIVYPVLYSTTSSKLPKRVSFGGAGGGRHLNKVT